MKDGDGTAGHIHRVIQLNNVNICRVYQIAYYIKSYDKEEKNCAVYLLINKRNMSRVCGLHSTKSKMLERFCLQNIRVWMLL